MAASGFTPISLYYSASSGVAPSAGNLVAGELALNTLDEKLYFKNSAGTVKVLASTASGTVTSVAASVPAFLSIAGSPITTSGTLAITYSGTALPVANGGTGQTTYTNGQLLIGNTTGNTLTKSTLTAGTGITITNGAGSISIAASGGSPAMTLISTLTASSNTTLSWTGLTLKTYLLVFTNFAYTDYSGVQIGYGATPTWITSGYYTNGGAGNNKLGIIPFGGATAFEAHCYITNMNVQSVVGATGQFNGGSSYGYFSSYGTIDLTSLGVPTAIRVICDTASGLTSGTVSLYSITS